MSEKVAMPGDGDEVTDRAKAGGFTSLHADESEGGHSQEVKKAPKVTKDKTKPEAEHRTEEKVRAQKDAAKDRGTMSPAQYEDDGWGDTPVQARPENQ